MFDFLKKERKDMTVKELEKIANMKLLAMGLAMLLFPFVAGSIMLGIVLLLKQYGII